MTIVKSSFTKTVTSHQKTWIDSESENTSQQVFETSKSSLFFIIIEIVKGR